MMIWEEYPPQRLDGAVPISAFVAFAGVAGYYSEATEASVEKAAARIDRGREAERVWRETSVAESIPAVAPDVGDVAMPLREAFEYYGTPRGAVANYVNGFAVQSMAYEATFDALGAAPAIKVPTLMVHSENALAPTLARSFFAALQVPRDELWVQSTGQIDFYDDPSIIAQATDRIAEIIKAVVAGRR
jgi:uncharacterized protein